MVYTHSYICTHQYLHPIYWFPYHSILEGSVGGVVNNIESSLCIVANKPYSLHISEMRHVEYPRQA